MAPLRPLITPKPFVSLSQRLLDGSAWSGPLGHRRQRPTAAWVSSAFAFAVVVALGSIAGLGVGRAGIELGLRLTARLAFMFFWPCYAAGALVVLFGPTFVPLKHRARELGLAFAAVLAVHLGLVGALSAVVAPPAVGVFIIFGPGVACALLMVLASHDIVGPAIGATGWWFLRNVAMNYLAFDFAIDFVHRHIGGSIVDKVLYLPFAALAILGPALRILAWLKIRLRGVTPC